MKKYIYFIIASISIILISCQDVIEIDLNSVEPKVVIEAKLYDQFYPANVLLTKTNNFFDSAEFITISGAQIFIRDEAGNQVQLHETDTLSGFYTADNFFGEIGKTYYLEIIAEEDTFTSSAEMRPAFQIDSVKSFYHGNEIPYFEEGYELNCFIKDSAGINDFGMLNIYKNFRKSNNIYLYDDTYTDGSSFNFRFIPEIFQEGDTALIEILTCDSEVYEYLYTYAEIASEFFQDSGTPYNPTTNIEGGALGYFGVFSLNGALAIIGEETVILP